MEHLKFDRISSIEIDFAIRFQQNLAIGAIHARREFFGGDEAITNYRPGREEWVATLIVSGADRRDAWAKRCQVVAGIQERVGLDACLDPSPEDVRERPARE